jgi:RNA polymerase sigma-70 factor (ECF subfamily)
VNVNSSVSRPTLAQVVKTPSPLEAGAELLTDLFCSLQAELTGTVFYLTGNGEDAKDIVQEAFMKCWRCRSQIEEVSNVRAWIFKVTINTAKDHMKSAWKRRSRPLAQKQWETSSEAPDPASVAAEKEKLNELRLAIMNLRQEQKEVFLLRQNGELTYEQIAEILHLPVGTVKTRMRYALQELRGLMSETVHSQ